MARSSPWLRAVLRRLYDSPNWLTIELNILMDYSIVFFIDFWRVIVPGGFLLLTTTFHFLSISVSLWPLLYPPIDSWQKVKKKKSNLVVRCDEW